MRKCKGHCRGLLPYITDYLEGDAGKSVCERIERHMVGCEKCRMYVDTHARIIEIYEKWRGENLTRGLEVRLQRRLRVEMGPGGRDDVTPTGTPRGARKVARRKAR